MRARTTAIAGVGLAAGACGVALLLSMVLPAHPASAPMQPSRDDAYVSALDTAMGWPAPGPVELQNDLTTGHRICVMLANGWNEAGVVANMLTWPSNHYSQGQLATAVHVTHLWLCSRPA